MVARGVAVSALAIVPSGDNDEATVPEMQNTRETAPEPSETSPETEENTDANDQGQDAPRARGRELVRRLRLKKHAEGPPRARARGPMMKRLVILSV